MHVAGIDKGSHLAAGVDAAHWYLVVHAQVCYFTFFFILEGIMTINIGISCPSIDTRPLLNLVALLRNL